MDELAVGMVGLAVNTDWGPGMSAADSVHYIPGKCFRAYLKTLNKTIVTHDDGTDTDGITILPSKAEA